jgi:hypothetical protein
MPKVISNKARKSARGEQCTFQIVGVCNGNLETTVLCHLSDETKGMGKKSDDISAAYGCSSCHDVIDRRVRSEELENHREWYEKRAMVRTLRRMIELGVIQYT